MRLRREPSDPCRPRHNWCGVCERCGIEHRRMLEVFALNDQLRDECRRRRWGRRAA